MAVTKNSKLWARASDRFRRRRNERLGAIIASLDNPRILDVGGLPDFWKTVPHAETAGLIEIVNSEAGEHSSFEEMSAHDLPANMTVGIADATDLEYADGAFDLVVCNSVLEHVNGWQNAQAAANELVRVARRGWVQVPAYEFPLEVHYMRPFVHWFAEPTRAWVLRLTVPRFRNYSDGKFRMMFLFVQLLTKREMQTLFPQATIESERFIGLRKSNIAVW